MSEECLLNRIGHMINRVVEACKIDTLSERENMVANEFEVDLISSHFPANKSSQHEKLQGVEKSASTSHSHRAHAV